MIRRSRRLVARTVAAMLVASVCVVAGWPVAAAPNTWSITASPNVGATGSELDGVSCVTPTNCVSVGYRVTASGTRQTLIEKWNGSVWSVVASPNQGTSNNTLVSVSCATATACVAVGSRIDPIGLRTLVEVWDGTTWSIVASANFGSDGNELLSVSCVSETSCLATGYAANGVGGTAALAETWDGTTWSLTSVPSPDASAVLNGVSCVNVTNCVAVGYSLSPVGRVLTLAETWDGATWSVTPTPSPSPARLTAVACVSATNCVAVGWSATTSKRTVIERWDGAMWSIEASPNVASYSTILRGVSCPTETTCVAIGTSATGSVVHTLVEEWNGTKWSIRPSPNRSLDRSLVSAVACPTTTNCVATGYSMTRIVRQTLVLSATSAPDATPPTVSLTTPADGSYFVVGQSAPAAYGCADETGGSGVATCSGSVANGSPIDASTSGDHTFSVTATDGAGQSSTIDSTYTVVEPVVASTVFPPAGGLLTTDAGAGPSALAPMATTIASPNEGDASIDQGAVTQATPAGFQLLGVQMDLVAPVAAADAPLTLTFDVDAAMVPAGESELTLSLLHDSATVPDCLGATTVPSNVSACVSSRESAPSGGGDVRLVAISVSAGRWNIARGAAAFPALSVASTTALEGNAGTTVRSVQVALSRPSARPVSVHYATADGSAAAPSDYVARSGSIDFAPGEVVHPVSVTINGDPTRELDETFAVKLSAASGATIATPSTTETIVDDDSMAPSTPTGVTVTPGDSSVEVKWTPPVDTGGRAIGGYVVTPYVGAIAQTPHVVMYAQAKPAVWISGLTNGVGYTFRVAASNDVGTGTPSPASAAVVAGAPVAPFVIAVGSANGAAVRWTVRSNNGRPVMSYVAKVYRQGSTQAIQSRTVTCAQPCTPATTWNVGGLSHQLYTFSVQARNANGAGPFGSTTILVGSSLLPGRPSRPTAVDSTFADAIRLDWVAPSNGSATIESYLVTAYINGVPQKLISVSAVVTGFGFLPPTKGASYTFTVQAKNAFGASPASVPSVPVSR